MTVIGNIIIGFAALVTHTVDGMNNVVFPEINISLLTIIISVAMAWDILVFYRRITDNPVDFTNWSFDASQFKFNRASMGSNNGAGKRNYGSGAVSPRRVSLTHPKGDGIKRSNYAVGQMQWNIKKRR